MFSLGYYAWEKLALMETTTRDHGSIRLGIAIDRSGSGLAQSQKVRRDGEVDRTALGDEPGLARLVVRSLDDFPAPPEVVEDADSFAGNARKKAIELARALSHWVLADDSGLAVDALEGGAGRAVGAVRR